MEKLGISSVGVEFGSAEFLLFMIRRNPEPEYTEHANLYHSHCFYEIHAVTEDSAVFLFENSEVTVHKGEIIIIGSNALHISSFRGNAKTSVLSLMLKKGMQNDGFYSYYSLIINNAAGRAIKLPNKAFEMIKGYSEYPKGSSISEFAVMKAEAYRMMAELFECIANDNTRMFCTPSGLSCDEELVILHELINDSGRTITEIADSIGYSQRHTSRLILKYFGKSLAEIRRERMAATAMKLKTVRGERE